MINSLPWILICLFFIVLLIRKDIQLTNTKALIEYYQERVERELLFKIQELSDECSRYDPTTPRMIRELAEFVKSLKLKS